MLEYHKFACEGLKPTDESFSMSEPLSASQHHKEDVASVSSSFNTPVELDANRDFVQCPLCQLSFPINLIERHASTCGE